MRVTSPVCSLSLANAESPGKLPSQTSQVSYNASYNKNAL